MKHLSICKRLVLGPVAIAIFSACGQLQANAAGRADRPANPAARSVHKEATRILNSIEKTEYKHATEIDEKKGIYYCDCSGLVGYILNRSVGQDGSGALGDGRKRPLAMDYEKFFAKTPVKPEKNGDARWQRIERLADARPGDVIAWRHEVPKPGNTGHVVIVDQRPVIEDDGLVRLVYIDSTTLQQTDDTRPDGVTGVGRGTMWFKIDENGRAIAHIRGSRTAEPKAEAISIGRALPAAKKPASSRAA